MPDILAVQSPKSSDYVFKKHVLAERVTEEGHLVDKDGNVVHAPKTRDVSDYSHVMRDFSEHQPLAAFMAKPKKLRFTTQAQKGDGNFASSPAPGNASWLDVDGYCRGVLPALLSIIHF